MNETKTITVQPNETLWSIAERELGDPKKWIDIFVKNMKGLEKKVYVQAGAELEMPEAGFDPSANFDPSGN